MSEFKQGQEVQKLIFASDDCPFIMERGVISRSRAMKELKQCPFCGKSACYKDKTVQKIKHNQSCFFWQSGIASQFTGMTYHPTGTIEAWNRRTP